MRKIRYKKSKKAYINPYEYMGNHTQTPVEIQLFSYDTQEYFEDTHVDLNTLQTIKTTDGQHTQWLNIHGLHQKNYIEKIAKHFTIEPHIIGEILNTTKRSRIEEYKNLVFISIRVVTPQTNSDLFDTEQISFIIKENTLISFQEKRGDFFTHIRERIQTNTGLVRTKKNDFLLYLMLDAILENYFVTIENFEDNIEALLTETKTISKPETLIKIENITENINYLKRSLIPIRELFFSLKTSSEDANLESISTENTTFFTRLYQKNLELLEQTEYDLNLLDSATNFYFSTQNYKMNQIMKTLTIVSVIFIPLTFIVGVYGMNFDNMPELHFKNGYFYVLAAMGALVSFMAIYFKQKKWF